MRPGLAPHAVPFFDLICPRSPSALPPALASSRGPAVIPPGFLAASPPGRPAHTSGSRHTTSCASFCRTHLPRRTDAAALAVLWPAFCLGSLPSYVVLCTLAPASPSASCAGERGAFFYRSRPTRPALWRLASAIYLPLPCAGFSPASLVPPQLPFGRLLTSAARSMLRLACPWIFCSWLALWSPIARRRAVFLASVCLASLASCSYGFGYSRCPVRLLDRSRIPLPCPFLLLGSQNVPLCSCGTVYRRLPAAFGMVPLPRPLSSSRSAAPFWHYLLHLPWSPSIISFFVRLPGLPFPALAVLTLSPSYFLGPSCPVALTICPPRPPLWALSVRQTPPHHGIYACLCLALLLVRTDTSRTLPLGEAALLHCFSSPPCPLTYCRSVHRVTSPPPSPRGPGLLLTRSTPCSDPRRRALATVFRSVVFPALSLPGPARLLLNASPPSLLFSCNVVYPSLHHPPHSRHPQPPRHLLNHRSTPLLSTRRRLFSSLFTFSHRIILFLSPFLFVFLPHSAFVFRRLLRFLPPFSPPPGGGGPTRAFFSVAFQTVCTVPPFFLGLSP